MRDAGRGPTPAQKENENPLMLKLRVVLVIQGCKWSHCTPTLLDVQVLGRIAIDHRSGFCDLCKVPMSTGYQWIKLIDQRDASPCNECPGKKTQVIPSRVKIQIPAKHFSHEISVECKCTIIFCWSLYISHVGDIWCMNCHVWKGGRAVISRPPSRGKSLRVLLSPTVRTFLAAPLWPRPFWGSISR